MENNIINNQHSKLEKYIGMSLHSSSQSTKVLT